MASTESIDEEKLKTSSRTQLNSDAGAFDGPSPAPALSTPEGKARPRVTLWKDVVAGSTVANGSGGGGVRIGSGREGRKREAMGASSSGEDDSLSDPRSDTARLAEDVSSEDPPMGMISLSTKG